MQTCIPIALFKWTAKIRPCDILMRARRAGPTSPSRTPAGCDECAQENIFMDPLDCLVIAPHPDDAELGMGGTIALLLSQGARVGILDLTDGEPTPHGSA